MARVLTLRGLQWSGVIVGGGSLVSRGKLRCRRRPAGLLFAIREMERAHGPALD